MYKIPPITRESRIEPEWEAYAKCLVTQHKQGKHKNAGNQDCSTCIEELEDYYAKG